MTADTVLPIIERRALRRPPPHLLAQEKDARSGDAAGSPRCAPAA